MNITFITPLFARVDYNGTVYTMELPYSGMSNDAVVRRFCRIFWS